MDEPDELDELDELVEPEELDVEELLPEPELEVLDAPDELVEPDELDVEELLPEPELEVLDAPDELEPDELDDGTVTVVEPELEEVDELDVTTTVVEPELDVLDETVPVRAAEVVSVELSVDELASAASVLSCEPLQPATNKRTIGIVPASISLLCCIDETPPEFTAYRWRRLWRNMCRRQPVGLERHSYLGDTYALVMPSTL